MRQCARECRRRKKAYLLGLEKQVAAFRASLHQLSSEVQTLKKENQQLRQLTGSSTSTLPVFPAFPDVNLCL